MSFADRTWLIDTLLWSQVSSGFFVAIWVGQLSLIEFCLNVSIRYFLCSSALIKIYMALCQVEGSEGFQPSAFHVSLKGGARYTLEPTGDLSNFVTERATGRLYFD